ncbi:MAG TPA: hypothetical protein VK653_19555 [Xanthobacteraceae bacterium]|nr:hypothetical protein [Xanthobacteraceae bacterium]
MHTVARAAYLREFLRCIRAERSLANHDIINQNHEVNWNFTEHAALLILLCNKRKNEAEKFPRQDNGLHSAADAAAFIQIYEYGP